MTNIERIRELLEEYRDCPSELDPYKVAVEIDSLYLILCPFCGCDLAAEREMFSQDKLFTGHNCKGKTELEEDLKLWD